VILIPLLFAVAGHDFYIARALIPAWAPLVVVLAAACTAAGARLPGPALAVVTAASFVLAQVRIDQNAQYQRPDWRGVAAALGGPGRDRAIVVDDGALATDPLKIYLPGIPWSAGGDRPVAIGEIDTVGDALGAQTISLRDPATVLSRRVVSGFLVQRFALQHRVIVAAAAAPARASGLIDPPPPAPAVLVQRAAG
jgi:hypothetical protein